MVWCIAGYVEMGSVAESYRKRGQTLGNMDVGARDGKMQNP